MQLQRLVARGINGRFTLSCDFHADINVITGRNGSGKTTFLKLLWYLISGNLERIPREVDFESVELETSHYLLYLESYIRKSVPTSTKRLKRRPLTYIKLKYTPKGQGEASEPFEIDVSNASLSDETLEVREMNQRLALFGSSVFFPTFRRVEGGFSIRGGRELGDLSPRNRDSALVRAELAYGVDIGRQLDEVSRRLSVLGHKFVCSISTADVVDLLTRRYADISQKTNRAHGELVAAIIHEIEDQEASGKQRRKSDTALLHTAVKTIDAIRNLTTGFQQQQESLLQPFSTLSEFINSVFQQKGVRITPSLDLGNAPEKIPSELLSAGEKQILSFLVYNAFYNDVPIFIDEPELSLHVDWQRVLFPTLLKQKTTNQFIIATHSPFIYSKYSDKEITLEETRGE